jgi:energy-converting hydrogenase Eha subunit F
MKTTWHTPVLWWVYTSVSVTALVGCTYLAVQQNYRQNMNDPQIQVAEDGAAKLSAGGVPADLVNRNAQLVDIATSLDTWVAVYDQSGMPLEASAQLNNAPPQPPKGLFDTTTWTKLKNFTAPTGKETRVTWQPQNNLRQAIVLVQAPNGYWVVSGRSMRLTEERILQLSKNMFIGWLVTEVALLVASFIGWRLLR